MRCYSHIIEITHKDCSKWPTCGGLSRQRCDRWKIDPVPEAKVLLQGELTSSRIGALLRCASLRVRLYHHRVSDY